MIDIQRQLKGLPPTEAEVASKTDYVFSERSRIIEALFTLATSSVREECERRVETIRALIALCSLQEGPCLYRQARSTSKIKTNQEELSTAVLRSLSLSKSMPIECKLTQCIFCLGSERLPTELRSKSFHSRGDLKRHFWRKHLRHHPDGHPIKCPHPKCTVSLPNTMHLQNHAELVHKTPT